MHTAPNPKSVGSNVRRAWHTGANPAGGNAGGHPVPHVLLRLPRIGNDESLAVEPPAAAGADRISMRLDPPAVKAYAGLHRELASREPAAPGPLSDFSGWLASGGKVWLTIIALLMANGMVLLWRQSPAPQAAAPLSTSADEEHSALKPVPLDDMTTTSDQTAMLDSDTRSRRSINEPTLASPHPEPDALNAPVYDEPVAEANPARQEPTLAPMRPEPTLARQEPTLAPKRDVLEPAAESPVATSDQQAPRSTPKATPAKPAPAVRAAEPPKEDVPPWESWNDERSQVAQQTPTEAATQQPTLAPTKDSPEAKSPEPRTAAAVSNSPTPVVTKPRAVAKLKGTINKPLPEPGNEHPRRSLY